MGFSWDDHPIAGESKDFNWDAHPVEAPQESFGKQLARSSIDALPIAGGAIGGIIGGGAGLFGGPAAPASVPLGGAAGAALGYAGGTELADLAKQYLLGDKPTANIVDQPLDVAKRVGGNLAVGASQEMGGQLLGKGLGYAGDKISSGAQNLGGKLKGAAEDLAINATGATAAQSEKFADDAGRQLLDRKLVRFGDSPEKIAQRVGEANNAASGQINSAISGLDAKGATASVEDIVSKLESKIDELGGDPSQAPLVKKLQGIIDDIVETGNPEIPLSQAEATKRGFGAKIRNWMDPEAAAANKEAYRAYMGEVEKQALGADPSLAAKFKEGKQTYGLLAPIQEAAERRAAQLNQSPIGGLLDTASTVAAGGNPMGAVARRAISPRITSSAASVTNNIGEFLEKSPQIFGRYAPVLQSAAQRGPQGVAATHFILQQTEPDYRTILNQVADQEDRPEEGF